MNVPKIKMDLYETDQDVLNNLLQLKNRWSFYREIFDQIDRSSLTTKYSFFQYISVLLFKESDNLLAVNETGHSGQAIYGILMSFRMYFFEMRTLSGIMTDV